MVHNQLLFLKPMPSKFNKSFKALLIFTAFFTQASNVTKINKYLIVFKFFCSKNKNKIMKKETQICSLRREAGLFLTECLTN